MGYFVINLGRQTTRFNILLLRCRTACDNNNNNNNNNRELRKLWQVKVKVVPVVVGVLGTIPRALEKHLKEIGTSVRVELLQKAALLGTARILRKTLEI